MRRSRLVVLVAWVLVVGAVGSGSVLSAPAVGQAPSPAGLCDASAVDQFSDVADTDYAAAYILCMRALGLSQGGSDGGYGPDRELSRGQMASFLIRLWTDQLGQQCPTGVVVPFADTAGTTHETNIECLFGLGITQGTSATTYGPQGPLKASQISRFLYRMYEKAGGDQCAGTAASELFRASECLLRLRVVPSTAEATAATPVIRAQMGVYVIGLWHNLTGRGLPPAPPQLSATTPSPTDRDLVVQESVGQAGGVVSGGGVTVTVPAGALSGEAVVAVREPLGRFGVEFGGPVVELDHDQPLAEPVTVSWDVSDLTEYQQRSLLLVTWDEELADWIPGNVDYTIADGVLTARIQQWSWWSYNGIVSASQTVQEILGRRVDAPKCAEGPLPFWVRDPVDPDDDFAASAIRLCY